LLRYKIWKHTQNDAWGNQEPCDEVFVSQWQEFLQTPYAQANVPDWFDKLENAIQSQEGTENSPQEQDSVDREEWMVISDLHTPFENSEQTESTGYWYQDRASYTDQQIGEMPNWIKTMQEQSSTTVQQPYDVSVECNNLHIIS
jgi:hypothetical protein